MLTPPGSSAEPLWLQTGIPEGLLENGEFLEECLEQCFPGQVVELKCLVPPFLVFFCFINHLFFWPEPCPAHCSIIRVFSGKVGGSKLQFHPNCCWWKRVMIQAHSSFLGMESKRGMLLPFSAASSMELSQEPFRIHS